MLTNNSSFTNLTHTFQQNRLSVTVGKQHLEKNFCSCSVTMEESKGKLNWQNRPWDKGRVWGLGSFVVVFTGDFKLHGFSSSLQYQGLVSGLHMQFKLYAGLVSLKELCTPWVMLGSKSSGLSVLRLLLLPHGSCHHSQYTAHTHFL